MALHPPCKRKTERVDLPHDATISEPRDPSIRIGYLCAFYHGGKYEYRKSFTLPREWAEKAVYLEFEGIYCRSEVFVNGSRISSLTNGYIGVSERIDHLLHAGENEVRVTVDTPITTIRAGIRAAASTATCGFTSAKKSTSRRTR